MGTSLVPANLYYIHTRPCTMQHTIPRLLAAFCSIHYFGLLFVTFCYFWLLLCTFWFIARSQKQPPAPSTRPMGRNVIPAYFHYTDARPYAMQLTIPRLLAAFCSIHYFRLLFVTFGYLCLLFGSSPAAKSSHLHQARAPRAQAWYRRTCTIFIRGYAQCSLPYLVFLQPFAACTTLDCFLLLLTTLLTFGPMSAAKRNQTRPTRAPCAEAWCLCTCSALVPVRAQYSILYPGFLKLFAACTT